MNEFESKGAVNSKDIELCAKVCMEPVLIAFQVDYDFTHLKQFRI